jgi:hypothetical protein
MSPLPEEANEDQETEGRQADGECSPQKAGPNGGVEVDEGQDCDSKEKRHGSGERADARHNPFFTGRSLRERVVIENVDQAREDSDGERRSPSEQSYEQRFPNEILLIPGGER